MPKVSVIVPIFNVEEFLPKCLDSLVNQTLSDIEIICVDDGSTDKSLQILQNYTNKDNRIKILNQQNKGAGLARTSAMKVAQGEYIGFVDSDDWVDLNFYETLYNKAKDADIVRTCYKEVCGKKVKENGFNKIINKKIKSNSNLDKNEHSIVIWNAIYRTEFLRKNNIDYFDENLPMCHDIAFTARVDLLSEKTVPVNGVFYYYRKNRAGQLITPSLKRIKCSLKANVIVTDFINSINLTEKDYKKAYGRCIWRLDSTFKKYLKVKEFDKDLQEEYLQTFAAILKNYKFQDSKKFKKKGFDLILNGNYKKYIKKKSHKLFGYENNLVHKTFTVFGLKLRTKTSKVPPNDKLEEYLKNWYLEKSGEYMDFKNPKNFNQKLQWLKLYDSTPEKTRLADKYEVRQWVKETIGEEYLIPLLGVWEKFDDIDFDKLPDKFVLKANHGSGWNIIVHDKNKLDKKSAKKKFDKWMKTNYAYECGLELHYKDMKPLIIAEKYITNGNEDLRDYKFVCFDGHIEFIWVDKSRYTEHKRNLYDTEWNLLPTKIIYENTKEAIQKPHNFDKMIEFAQKMSKGFKFVRVDFYEVDDQIYFGEMTFTSSSGTEKISDKNLDKKLCELIKL